MPDSSSTAVAKRDGPTKAPVSAGGAVAAMVPQDLEQAFRLATALARAGDMIPRHYQGKPDSIMAAILKGAEVGLAPMQALACIAVVNGRPTIYGDGLTSLIFRAGHHLDVVVEGEGDARVAVATLTRGDTGRRIERRFSVADAKLAGLWGKQGPWQSYPARMLEWRAKTWAARDGAPDALMGLTLPDDAQAFGPDTARDVTPRQRRRPTLIAPDETEAPAEDVIHEGAAEDAPEAEVMDAEPEPQAEDQEPEPTKAERAIAAMREAADAGNKAKWNRIVSAIASDADLDEDAAVTALYDELKGRMGE